MKKFNVSQIIHDLARDNFKMYKEDYPIENGLATEECASNILTLAENYWNNRNEDEFDRDERLGIGLEDYAVWCQSAFESTI